MSRVKRLLVTGRVFFVTVNIRKDRPNFTENEYPLMIAALEDSRRKLSFRLCGYVLMPDHWHALIGVDHPLTISRAVQDIKWIVARRIGRSFSPSGNARGALRERFLQISHASVCSVGQASIVRPDNGPGHGLRRG